MFGQSFGKVGGKAGISIGDNLFGSSEPDVNMFKIYVTATEQTIPSKLWLDKRNGGIQLRWGTTKG